MHQRDTLVQKLRQLLVILLPILVSQVSMLAMSFFDTIMSGQASTNDLAGVAIGSSIWLPVYTGLGGVFIAVTPIVAQLIGANRKRDIPFIVIQGIYLALFTSVLVIIVGALTLKPILSLMNLDVGVNIIAYKFILALALGMPPLFVFYVLRSFIDALGKTRITMIISLSSLPINITLNYILIFGKLGFPALGGVGTGIASAITYWCITFLALAIITWQSNLKSYGIFKRLFPLSIKAWKDQLKIGIPIAFAIFFETSIFALVTLLMSNFSTPTIAAHQAAMNFASMLYMVPLSMAMALTILIGFEVGGKRFNDAKQYSYLGIGISLGMAVICASGLLLFRGQIAGLYSTDIQVFNMIKSFLIFALFFQLSDAIAAPIQGILRGYKDVNFTFIMALISYWAIGLPLGYYLANFTTLGAFGYWIGLISGLAFNAVSLLNRLVRVQKVKYNA